MVAGRTTIAEMVPGAIQIIPSTLRPNLVNRNNANGKASLFTGVQSAKHCAVTIQTSIWIQMNIPNFKRTMTLCPFQQLQQGLPSHSQSQRQTTAMR